MRDEGYYCWQPTHALQCIPSHRPSSREVERRRGYKLPNGRISMLIPLSAMPLAEQVAANEAHIKFMSRVYQIQNNFYCVRARRQCEDMKLITVGVHYLDEEEYDQMWKRLRKRWWWQ
jgi:hypothetical protein